MPLVTALKLMKFAFVPGDDACQRRFADARRSPEDHRAHAVLLDELAQHLARAEQVRSAPRIPRASAGASASQAARPASAARIRFAVSSLFLPFAPAVPVRPSAPPLIELLFKISIARAAAKASKIKPSRAQNSACSRAIAFYRILLYFGWAQQSSAARARSAHGSSLSADFTVTIVSVKARFFEPSSSFFIVFAAVGAQEPFSKQADRAVLEIALGQMVDERVHERKIPALYVVVASTSLL